MGLNVQRTRTLIFLSTVLLAGTVTAFCGPVGFIGLAVPLVCLVLFGSGSFLLPSMACILVLLLVLRKPIERADGIVPGQTEKQKEAAQ